MIISQVNQYNSIAFECKYKPITKVQKEIKIHISKATKGLDRNHEQRIALISKYNKIKDAFTYRDIAEKDNVSITTAYNKVKRTTIEIQEDTKSETVTETNFVHQFKSKFDILDKDERRVYDAIHKKPELLNHNTQEIKENIASTVDALKQFGLTEQKFIDAALKQPPLLYIPSKTIVNNFKTVTEAFADEMINPKTYLKNCLQNPSILYSKPETIIKHIKIARFILKDKAANSKMLSQNPKDLINKAIGKKLSNADEHYYTRFLNRKLFKSIEQDKLIESDLKNKLKTYLLQNPDVEYEFKVVEDECAEEFIEFAKNFSQNVLGKNVFNITII